MKCIKCKGVVTESELNMCKAANMLGIYCSSCLSDFCKLPSPIKNTYIMDTAIIDSSAKIHDSVKIWHFAQVREGAEIGENTIIGKGAYIGRNVKIGKNCKIGNNAQIFEGVTIGDGVFVGPCVCFTNDKYPSAINKDGSIKGVNDWTLVPTFVGTGSSIGANSTIVCGVVLGSGCVVGAGSVVTKNVKHDTCVVGNPARIKGELQNDGR
jgi:UDP-2-acetamido-3-amino-2,3-dideoxy-glucuronate N-acetyltransferase